MDAINQHTLTAFFRDRADAEEATRKLSSAGIAESSIRLVPGKESDSVAAADVDEGKGFWESLGDFFFPADDRAVYAEGLRRGGYLVTVSNVTDAQHETAVDILDDEGTIDVDEWSESWRADGWTPTNPGFDRDRTLTDPQIAEAGDTIDEAAAAEREARREEEIIGKRDLDTSGTRVRSYVYDRPENQTGSSPRV
jgi:hypothetical protein